MAHSPRNNTLGYHHISNRGAGQRSIFIDDEDKRFFIALLCNYSYAYDFKIHGYSLISVGYDIVIEITKNNMPTIMKIINREYTLYFNKKYIFRGHLWEGRYKSWYLHTIEFVFDILGYIEYLPSYLEEAYDKESYYYSCYRQYIGLDERLSCLHHSIIFQRFNTVREIKRFFYQPVDLGRINSIHTYAKKHKPTREKRPKKMTNILPLTYFSEQDDITIRNKKIYRAYHRGYSQANIGRALGISQQAVYKVIKKLSEPIIQKESK